MLDGGRGRPTGLATAPQGLGDEIRPVIGPDERRRRGIELKIHGPDLVEMFGPMSMSPHRAAVGPCPLALSGSGPLQAFLPPQQAVGHEAAPADVLNGNLPETISEHGLLQLGLRQKLFGPGVLLHQLSQPPGLLGLHPPVLLPPAVVGRLRYLQVPADIGDGLALGDQLLGGLAFADDLLRCVPGAFHGEVPGPVWPAEDTHSPWTCFQGPRQISRSRKRRFSFADPKKRPRALTPSVLDLITKDDLDAHHRISSGNAQACKDLPPAH